MNLESFKLIGDDVIMRILEEFISKLGKTQFGEGRDRPFEAPELLFHLYNLLENLTTNGSDLKNTFVLYSVKNNPNQVACENFKRRFIKVDITRDYVNSIKKIEKWPNWSTFSTSTKWKSSCFYHAPKKSC